MKLIPLTQGYFTKVDDDDFRKYAIYRWHVGFGGKNKKYPRPMRGSHKGKYFYLYREITNCPKGMMVDHINGDTLDNRKCNLRICNRSENLLNSSFNKNNTSGFKGVIWHSQNKKWQAKATINKKQIYFGSSNDKVEAAKMYDEGITKLFGELCFTNKKLGLLP